MNDPQGLVPRYEKYAEQEARYWGNVRSREDNPQLWDDPLLFELFLKPQWDHLLRTVTDIGGNVLEVGCGEGNLALELARRGCRVEGLDISESRIARAKERAEDAFRERPGAAPKFAVADLNIVHLPAGTYDVVVAHDALHHILMLDRLMAQIASALKPGGHLIVYDYVGMGKIRKFLAAFFYAALPTYRPYASKFRLRKRFGRFMAGESGKRNELVSSADGEVGDSPFEEVSQESIVPLIERRFRVIERKESLPFFFYLAPKVRFPQGGKATMWRTLRRLDHALLSSRLSRGAYIFLHAVTPT